MTTNQEHMEPVVSSSQDGGSTQEVLHPIVGIEQAAQNVGQALSEVTRQTIEVGNRQRRRSIRMELEAAIAALRAAPHFPKISNNQVLLYWRHENVVGRVFRSWTLNDVVRHSAQQLLDLKGAGRVRLASLVDALRFAASGGTEAASETGINDSLSTAVEVSYGWAEKMPAQVREEVQYLFEHSAGCPESAGPLPRLLRHLPRVVGREHLMVVWATRHIFHRRLAEQIGITESRVSQIIHEVNAKTQLLINAELPQLKACWDALLQQPAVSERTLLSPWFDLGLDAEHRSELGGFFLEQLGAVHPELPAGTVKGYWCYDASALRRFAQPLVGKLPCSHEELIAHFQTCAPALADMDPDILRRAMGRSVSYLKDHQRWFTDRAEALDFIMRMASRPLSRHEIARALGVKPTQTKALLLEHPGIERIGSNLKRVYCLKADRP